MEICWTILRYFGYDDKLQIVESMWDDGTISHQNLEQARSFEFKKSAITFLNNLFNSYMNEKT